MELFVGQYTPLTKYQKIRDRSDRSTGLGKFRWCFPVYVDSTFSYPCSFDLGCLDKCTFCNNWGWKLAFWAGVPRQLGVSVDVFSCANYAIKVNFVERNASQCIYFQRKQTAIRLTLRKHVQFCRCCYVSITFLVCAVIFIFCLVNSVLICSKI